MCLDEKVAAVTYSNNKTLQDDIRLVQQKSFWEGYLFFSPPPKFYRYSFKE